MVVADLLDLAFNDFHHLGAHRLDYFAEARPRPMEERLGDAASIVARAHAQVAPAVGEQRKAGLVVAPHFVASFDSLPVRIDEHRMLMEAGHHTFDVMAVEGVEISMDY